MTMHFPLPLPPGTDTHVISQLGATTYTQSAVHFNAGVNLTSSDGFGTPTCISYSFWFDMASYDVTHHNTDFWFFNIQNHDNSDSYGYGITGQDDWAAAGQFFNWWAGDPESNFIAWNLPPYYGSTNLINNQWHHILCTVRSDGQVVLYIDDQHIPVPPQTASETWPEGTTFDLAGIMTLPIVNSGQDFDMADVWIAPGVDLTDDNGLIPEATRRQFVSNQCQPVDPTGWPTSMVQLYGNAAAFVTNRGTGPDFTLTGVLEDASAGASPGARVQIDGLKGGVYSVAVAASDWTGLAAYALTPTYGYNFTRHQFTSSFCTNFFNPTGSMVIQKYGPLPVDVAITRPQTTLAGDGNQPTIFDGITDSTPFYYGGGCGYAGTIVMVSCHDWNGATISMQMLHPNGQWITIERLDVMNANAGYGCVLPAGMYRFNGAESLGAPIYGCISPINFNAAETVTFVGITEPTDTFTLQGGIYGGAFSSTDNSGAQAELWYIPPGDGDQIDHMEWVFNMNQATQAYLPSGTYYFDPTNLNAPLTCVLTSTPLLTRQSETQTMVITEDTEFQLKGTALEYQISVTSADWPDGVTIALEYLSPDGTWLSIPNMSVTSNNTLWPGSGSGTYRLTGVADLANPLYVGVANTPQSSTDAVSFTGLTSTVEFELQGGQYAMSFASYNNGVAQWTLNYQSPDGTWTNVATNGDTPGGTQWMWLATGRYQIDASSMDNGVNVNISSLPL